MFDMIELQAFVGTWRITREIDDHRAGQMASFRGTATWTPDETGLAYWEGGDLSLAGSAPVRAERRYLWRKAWPGIAVLFADGRGFHIFAPVGEPEVAHLCGADLYLGHYCFGAWPQWQVAWQVLGPRKDYTMRSHYRRTRDH